MQTFRILLLVTSLFAALMASASPASAEGADHLFDSGRLLATAGVSQVEGAGGGGLVPWALITGYGTRDAIGANAHYTVVALPDFTLQTGGIAVGLFNRVELSAARQAFNTHSAGGSLGLGNGFTFHQNVFGAKVRILGDAVYDQDRWMPQVAAGIQYKSNDRGSVLRSIGARDSNGIDYYLSASKLLLAQSVLLNGTVRETRANQFGLLGFGGDKNNDYSTEFEGSAALLLSRQLAVGAEYRTKPNNLSFAKEEYAADLFLAYFFNKHVSATLALVDLGDVAKQTGQQGFYVSLQVGF